MKLPELTLGVSLDTFGARDTAARPFGRFLRLTSCLRASVPPSAELRAWLHPQPYGWGIRLSSYKKFV